VQVEAQAAPSVPLPEVLLGSHRDHVAAQQKTEVVGSKKYELRQLIAWSTQQFESSELWEEFISKCRDPRDDLHPNVNHLPHQSAHLLGRLRVRGATVATKTTTWSLQHKLATLERGYHQSANQHVEFLCEDFIDMINKG
jgi:hypothetical protein